MLKQFSDIRSLWKTNRVDLVRGLGTQGGQVAFSHLIAPLDPLTPAVLFPAYLARDLCGHHPAGLGSWPGGCGSVLPAARGGPNAAVSQAFHSFHL